jgi:MoaA/NifB/PqqE/SkfB family radical SAM enzyme
MANKDIFCSLPWHGARINDDGSYGICCTEKKPIHDNNTKYNLKEMSLGDWYNSDPAKTFRQKILSDEKNSTCINCYQSDMHHGESLRYRHNFKNAIFTKDSFEKSYKQSPWYDKFEASRVSGATDLTPRFLHLDFGNECNFACKMCNEKRSSKIASVLYQNNLSNFKKTANWHRDPLKWKSFLNSLDNLDLNRIEVRGGEPTLIKKFIELLDYLVANKRFDISINFSTNGSFLYENINFLEKLEYFKDVDIAVSIETTDKANDYIRQGADTQKLLSAVEYVQSLKKQNLQIVLQSTLQALNISRFVNLAKYAWENNIILESHILVVDPHLRVDVLPLEFRQQYTQPLIDLANKIDSNNQQNFIQNGRNLGTLNSKIIRECHSAVHVLNSSEHVDSVPLRQRLAKHCEFWDKQYNLDISEYIPELYPMFKEWGYAL